MVTDAGSLLPCRRISGTKKFPQALTNVYTAMTHRPGRMSGKTMRRSEPNRELPSIQADSSSSRGTASMKERPTHVANGSDVAVRNHTVQNFELMKFTDT